MTTAAATVRAYHAEARQQERIEGARAVLRTALTLVVAYGDRAEAMAHQYTEDDPRYARVATLVKEALR